MHDGAGQCLVKVWECQMQGSAGLDTPQRLLCRVSGQREIGVANARKLEGTVIVWQYFDDYNPGPD